jgi:hypothetical protein
MVARADDVMSDPGEETEWRAEFERIGETHLRDELNFRSVPFPEPPLKRIDAECLGRITAFISVRLQ